jgi:hypothetical protein
LYLLPPSLYSFISLYFGVPSPPAALVPRFARLSPPPRYDTRRFITSVLLWFCPNSGSIACFTMHFQVHSEPSPPAALVLRFARLSPPPRYKVRHAQIHHVCATLVLSEFWICCVFYNALSGPFRTEPACGASTALRAFVPAPKVRYAQIHLRCAPCILHGLSVLDCTPRSILCRARLRR